MTAKPVFTPTPAGISHGDTVDVLLDRGGYIGVRFAGRSGDMYLFWLEDGRAKAHESAEIVLMRRAS